MRAVKRHFTKEGAYMSQEETKEIIKVKLCVKDEIDFLEFALKNGTHSLNVNAEDNQEDIKKMFCHLIPMLEITAVLLELEVEEGYDNKLLEEVSVSYIADLNTEIENVRANILEKQAEEEEL